MIGPPTSKGIDMATTTLKFGLVLVSLLLVPTLQAQELTGTLKKAKETGEFTLGIRESSIPFSYLDDKQQAIGYTIEICQKVVEAVKAELKMPGLKVSMQPVTSSNRIPLLQNGTIDLECGSTTNSVARQEQVAFGPTHFVINVTAAVKKKSGIKSLIELDGKPVSNTSGTTGVALLKQYEKTKAIDVKEIFGKDHAESFLLLADDRVAAFVMDDVLLAGQIANAKNPGEYMILSESLRQEPYGPMIRKGDPQFKNLVDKTLTAFYKSPEMPKLYAKWFTSPIPPKGINLNFVMTPAIKEALENPNDRGVK
jgi:glutamate/aspartate transport system substrate-binding protein